MSHSSAVGDRVPIGRVDQRTHRLFLLFQAHRLTRLRDRKGFSLVGWEVEFQQAPKGLQYKSAPEGGHCRPVRPAYIGPPCNLARFQCRRQPALSRQSPSPLKAGPASVGLVVVTHRLDWRRPKTSMLVVLRDFVPAAGNTAKNIRQSPQ